MRLRIAWLLAFVSPHTTGHPPRAAWQRRLAEVREFAESDVQGIERPWAMRLESRCGSVVLFRQGMVQWFGVSYHADARILTTLPAFFNSEARDKPQAAGFRVGLPKILNAVQC